MATNTKALKAILLVAAIALPSIGSAQAQQRQKLYKWTDENGVIQYIDSIPPDYCFLQIAIAKCPTNRAAEKGEITPEEDAAAHARASAAEADKRAKEEIARHDRMLLETYISISDIEDLRDRRLDLLESQIKLTETYLGNLRKKLADLQAEASNFKPYSTREDAPPIPEDFARELSQTEAAINSLEQTLARTRADYIALKKSFDDDIARFIEIKGR
jgi:hypothetical protein